MDAHQIAKLSVDNQRTWISVLLVEALGSRRSSGFLPVTFSLRAAGDLHASSLFFISVPWIPFSSVSISTIEGFYAFDHGMKHIFCDQWQLVTTRIVSPFHSGLLS